METPGGSQTLAAGELVWAKAKGRGRNWWPARLRGACAAGSLVSCFGEDDPRCATQLRSFADPEADGMARANLARGFLAAVEEAQSRAVAILQKDLACACVSPPSAAVAVAAETEEGSVGVTNLAPSEFLASLRDAAALGALSVGLVDRVRLKSWVHAVAQGWGPDGVRHYPRRSVDDLVDKIDLDVVPAGDDRDAAGDEALERSQETPGQKRCSVASVMDELDAGEEDEQKNESGDLGTGLAVKRERKKSKYLSPPYTNLVGALTVEKLGDLPMELLPSARKGEKKVLLDNVEAQKVLLLVRHFGKDILHKTKIPKDANEFLNLLRSSAFVQGANHGSYMEHKCPVEIVFVKTGKEGAGFVSDSCTSLKQGKSVLKRTKKKDQEGSGGSSIKRKKTEKTSPAATLGCGVSITPAIPIRQMRAKDIRTQVIGRCSARGMGVGVPDQNDKLVSEITIPAAFSGGIKSAEEQDRANGGSALKTTPVTDGDNSSNKSAKNNDHECNAAATKPGIDIQEDINMRSVIVDMPVRSVKMEATETETDVQVDMDVRSVIVHVPVRSAQMEGMGMETNTPTEINEKRAVANVPVISGTLPTHGDISLPADGNKDNVSVEVHTVNKSYASLGAMVPKLLNKAEEVTTGTSVIATSRMLQVVGQKGEQPNQKKIADEATANHSPGNATNGTLPNLPNSAHKKKKKRSTQYFENPAEIMLKFTDGVILPSKEELLSEFSKFGFVIESKSDIVKDKRSAHVMFGKSIDAEEACRNQAILGQFGPPFATISSLNYPPGIELSIPLSTPAPKPPKLEDMRKNLEDMISSLTGQSPLKKANSSAGPKAVPENLLGQMQGLLSKVDKMLSGSSSSSTTTTSTPH